MFFHKILLLLGPDLPTPANGLSMVESVNGILAMGGYYFEGVRGPAMRPGGNTYSMKSILRLECNNGNECQWIKAGELNHFWDSDVSVIPYTDITRIPLLQPLVDIISVVISWFKKLYY